MSKAIGLINTSCGGDRALNEQMIRDLAHRHGYELAGLLTITENTYMPTTQIVHTAVTNDAAAILAPLLEHFGVALRAIAGVRTVVAADGTLTRAR
ncbi:hypothetical protein [Nocardia australiensis]|uniref:hypothetical protein n=1 Tax=Nocardia australiensis TaxID=2887191 RepID=UPI001D1482CA|nr:hypothetical protein [Nocardia australiensis]